MKLIRESLERVLILEFLHRMSRLLELFAKNGSSSEYSFNAAIVIARLQRSDKTKSAMSRFAVQKLNRLTSTSTAIQKTFLETINANENVAKTFVNNKMSGRCYRIFIGSS